MLQNEIVISTIVVSINILSFISGYTLAKIGQKNGVYNPRTKSKVDNNIDQINKVSIDDTKYVVNISTDGLEKKYSELGETKKSDQKIESAIQKLKNMKG